MNRVFLAAGLLFCLVLAGCGSWFKDHQQDRVASAEARRVQVEVVARDNRCEPAVLAVDREGRAVQILFRVTSVGKEHHFLIPGLGVRQTIRAGATVEVPVVVEQSSIYEYACTSLRWIGPLTSTGKLAIK